MNLKEVFEKYSDEYIEFDRIVNPRHQQPDICAFLMLADLVPNLGRDVVAGAEHDKIWLDTDCEKLAEVATDLIRCGVMYDEDTESLSMFV